MEIKYNVQAPPKKAFNGGAKSEEVKAIEDFLTSGNAKNMCFEYGTEKEAKTKLSTVSSHKRKWNEKNPKKYDSDLTDCYAAITEELKTVWATAFTLFA